MKKILLLALGALYLTGCPFSSSSDSEHPYFNEKLRPYLKGREDVAKAEFIYFADSNGITDGFTQNIEFYDGASYPNQEYYASANTMDFKINMNIRSSLDGGSVQISCDNSIYFDSFNINDLRTQVYHRGNSSLEFKESVKINGTSYNDVLVFKATNTDINKCSFNQFFYAANDGIVRIVTKNGINFDRISEKEYRKIKDKRIKETAIADSIAQAVADSIAQAAADSIAQVADSVAHAVADSIIAANTTEASPDSSAEIEIPQEVADAAENAANCIKNAYSSGKLSALKDCVD